MQPALVLAAAAAGLALVPAAFAAHRDVVPQQSSNWAGYAISDPETIATGTADPTQAAPLEFSDVTASFRVPAVSCAVGTATYSAFWVGLGGFSSEAQALEQTGVDADCTEAGRPRYYAWYELVPAAAVQVRLPVGAGDVVTTSVVVNGTDVLVQVKNRTRGVAFTRHLPMANPDVGSAEWVAEAPSACSSSGSFCRVLPLANFGTVGFLNVAAVADGHAGTLVDPTWSAARISLVPRSDRGFFGSVDNTTAAGAVPALLSADGRSFAVRYLPNANVLGG